ncbi:hypothetical protein VZC37_03355 [Gordonia sp. LSe1-13]|uniref:Glycine zipper family protein n=1 Tax=Gordonia sesuvii TaxID=3116777 RepID=A0ABU7M8B8_9ACTN|nr:hypothetical protein [Gordonia sp. LSe1-13]
MSSSCARTTSLKLIAGAVTVTAAVQFGQVAGATAAPEPVTQQAAAVTSQLAAAADRQVPTAVPAAEIARVAGNRPGLSSAGAADRVVVVPSEVATRAPNVNPWAFTPADWQRIGADAMTGAQVTGYVVLVPLLAFETVALAGGAVAGGVIGAAIGAGIGGLAGGIGAIPGGVIGAVIGVPVGFVAGAAATLAVSWTASGVGAALGGVGTAMSIHDEKLGLRKGNGAKTLGTNNLGMPTTAQWVKTQRDAERTVRTTIDQTISDANDQINRTIEDITKALPKLP